MTHHFECSPCRLRNRGFEHPLCNTGAVFEARRHQRVDEYWVSLLSVNVSENRHISSRIRARTAVLAKALPGGTESETCVTGDLAPGAGHSSIAKGYCPGDRATANPAP